MVVASIFTLFHADFSLGDGLVLCTVQKSRCQHTLSPVAGLQNPFPLHCSSPYGRYFLCHIHGWPLFYHLFRVLFSFLKIISVIHCGNHCTVYSIIVGLNGSINSPFFYSGEKQVVQRDTISLQSLSYRPTHSHSQ